VGFVVDKVALGHAFLRVLRFYPANIIPPLLHIHLSPPHEVYDSSDQAEHYHHLGPKLGASFLTRHFGWKQNKKVKKRLDSTHKYKVQNYWLLKLLVPTVTIRLRSLTGVKRLESDHSRRLDK
jgi:hypothetical protein